MTVLPFRKKRKEATETNVEELVKEGRAVVIGESEFCKHEWDYSANEAATSDFVVLYRNCYKCGSYEEVEEKHFRDQSTLARIWEVVKHLAVAK